MPLPQPLRESVRDLRERGERIGNTGKVSGKVSKGAVRRACLRRRVDRDSLKRVSCRRLCARLFRRQWTFTDYRLAGGSAGRATMNAFESQTKPNHFQN